MKRVISVNVSVEIKIPAPPNYLVLVNSNGAAIPIEDFLDEDLDKIGQAYTKQLIQHAKERRSLKK